MKQDCNLESFTTTKGSQELGTINERWNRTLKESIVPEASSRVIIRNILLWALQEQIDPQARSRMHERGRDLDAK